ncbi:hypothetical protein B4064_3870 [Caldibacillus thermoamylovorans]|nr:hypothetical protein B4064_3870 [Caldibacillus thermoamylovorans]KIO60525.1 hypothetical protein B4166_3783 [Caldibacillus thermoamylovorans]
MSGLFSITTGFCCCDPVEGVPPLLAPGFVLLLEFPPEPVFPVLGVLGLGFGFGLGLGLGCGFGVGSGCGCGDGSGCGFGDGSGCGSGDG